MKLSSRVELKIVIRSLRNLLPYFKDWNDWNAEIRRLERNLVALRRHRYRKLARTLENALPVLRTILNEERKEHAFTINRLVARLNREDKAPRRS